jgi:hypothetical protein
VGRTRLLNQVPGGCTWYADCIAKEPWS